MSAVSYLRRTASDSTFVRSFAYATGPAYGLLLDATDPDWKRQIREGGSFASMLGTALNITLPANLDQASNNRAATYDWAALKSAETARDARRQQLIAKYKAKFADGPTLTLPCRHISVQFDPRNLQPLGEAGIVYPNMRITDEWGIIEVTNGALMKADWSAVIVSAPSTVRGNPVKGEGWTLDLKPGWKLAPGAREGDYVLAAGP